MTNETAAKRELSRIDARKQRTRAAILSAAATLFLRDGYEATTMQEIAILAEVGLGTMYGYFPSKEDVLRTALEGRRKEIVTRAARSLHDVHDAVDRACIILEHVWHFLRDNREMALALIGFEANRRRGASVETGDTYQALITTLRGGTTRGQVAPLPVEAAARSLLSTYTWAALGLGIWREAGAADTVLNDLEQLTRQLLTPQPPDRTYNR